MTVLMHGAATTMHHAVILSNEPPVTRVLMQQMDRLPFRVSARCANPSVIPSRIFRDSVCVCVCISGSFLNMMLGAAFVHSLGRDAVAAR